MTVQFIVYKPILTLKQIFHMLFGHTPRVQVSRIDPDNSDYAASHLVSLLGEVPKEWEPQWMLIKERTERKLGGPFDAQTWTLETYFQEKVHHPSLTKLLPIIQGLMKFRSSDRIEASEALKLLDSIICEFEDNDMEFGMEGGELALTRGYCDGLENCYQGNWKRGFPWIGERDI